MSYSPLEPQASRSRRALSSSSHTAPRSIPQQQDSGNASTAYHERPSGSVRGLDTLKHAQLPPSSYNQREPTRSFVYSSFRGSVAPFDSVQNVRSVREDTAELASFALSDQTAIRSPSPSHQTNLESYFTREEQEGSDRRRRSSAGSQRPTRIAEESEPPSPGDESGPSSSMGGVSAITTLLRSSPPSDQQATMVDGAYGGTATAEDYSTDKNQSKLAPGPEEIRIEPPTETTPLVQKPTQDSYHPDWIRGQQDIEAQSYGRRSSWPKIRTALAWPSKRGMQCLRTALNPKSWDRKALFQHIVREPAGYFPSVVLGCLLNILDALSYGMILFPLGQPIFEKLGSAGISMFYVSCIIAQLVYSCGGSVFKGGIGSEMIEVVPFFHKMAFTIMARVGEDKPQAVIATTITAYALSSILTGLVFFLMGVCRFGYIVGFIPRHILIGCIGGVGWFLVATGFEVTARLDGNLNYNFATLKKLFEADTVLLWLIPLLLAIFLYISEKKVNSKYYIPAYILTIPAVFYFFVLSLDELNLGSLRNGGWVFTGPEADEPWWYFYTLYDFKLVNWAAIAETVPAMFALTFFGVLHVPINVPALAFNVGEDHMDLDRELIAHGLSNALSGFAGSIQNYLVYTNSVLFIRSGGNGRLAGIMLAFATFGIMIIGPVLIGFIPVMMVGVLIFVLGFELFVEAVWDPRKKLGKLEYLTVIVIVLVMGIYDFVVGIFVGIGLAFVSSVVQTSRVPAVRASYSGEIAGSTVRRNQVQHQYLRTVGKQIHITKLAGFLFFGTIVSVEDRIRKLVEEKAFNDRPIRYLIFDLWHVTGIDYSAAEAFNRINRIFSAKGVHLVVSGVDPNGPIGLSLRAVGLGADVEDAEVKLFEDLNSALESCENELLKTFYANKEARLARRVVPTEHLDVPQNRPSKSSKSASYSIDAQFSSPRQNHLHNVANRFLNETEPATPPKWHSFKQPLPLILQTFQGLTDKNEDFWFPALQYFERKHYPAGTILYERGAPAKGFYLLEEGIMRADYVLPQGRYFESIVAGTTCGELPFFSETERTATVQAERDCVAWLLTREGWKKLQKEHSNIATELLSISLKLTSERMDAITSYVLTTAG